MLAPIPGVDDLTLTTNASLLASKAQALADAGLHRVTVSLDALDDPTFRRMNDVGFPVSRVLDGIAAAEAAGLGPIKVNAVVRRGLNEHAILDLAEQFRGTGTTVRFIEYMDVGHTNGWRLDDVVPAAEIVAAHRRALAARADRARTTAARSRGAGGTATAPARSASSPASPQPFCGDCTRARLSADGQPLHLPVRDERPRPPRAAPRRRRPTPTSPMRCAASGPAATTATRSCAPSRRSTCRRWR